MKKRIFSVFFVIATIFVVTACTIQKIDLKEIDESQKQSITLYSLAGTIQIDVSEMEEYLANGWYTEPVITMYATDGETIVIPESEIDAYEGVGWYIEPIVIMYAVDGRTRVTLESEVELYKGVGWYAEPVITMYATDGGTIVIPKSEVESYKNVGWYTEPVVTMYALDGRTRDTLESEVEAYKRVGWYVEPVILLYASDGRTRITLESEVESYKNAGWFTEPVDVIGPFLPVLNGNATDAEILNYVNQHYETLLGVAFRIEMGAFLKLDWKDYISHPDAAEYGQPGLYKVTEKGFKSIEDIKTYINKNFSESYVNEIDFASYYIIKGNLYANVLPFGIEGSKTYSFDSIVRNPDNTITVSGSFAEDEGTGFGSCGESTCKFVLENGLWKCHLTRDYY